MEDVKSEGCGPGCDCGKPSGNKKVKTVICLIVLLAVCGIFVYKANSAKQSVPTITETAFAAPIVNQATGQEPAVKAVEDKKNVGEFHRFACFTEQISCNQDAVFVFVPANDNEIVSKETLDAIASAEQKLKSSGVNIGLYTLQFSPSKEYANIAAQLTLAGYAGNEQRPRYGSCVRRNNRNENSAGICRVLPHRRLLSFWWWFSWL